MVRVGQQVVGLDEDRLPGRVAVGVLTRVFVSRVRLCGRARWLRVVTC